MSDSLMFEPMGDWLRFEPPKRAPFDFIMLSRYGGVMHQARPCITTIDWADPGPGAEAMRGDGWAYVCGEWIRKDGGLISGDRSRTGRYAGRLPTNRQRKRERGKARRREARLR